MVAIRASPRSFMPPPAIESSNGNCESIRPSMSENVLKACLLHTSDGYYCCLNSVLMPRSISHGHVEPQPLTRSTRTGQPVTPDCCMHRNGQVRGSAGRHGHVSPPAASVSAGSWDRPWSRQYPRIMAADVGEHPYPPVVKRDAGHFNEESDDGDNGHDGRSQQRIRLHFRGPG